MTTPPPAILRCLAVDDEPFALKLLEDDISKVPFLKLVATCSSPAEASIALEKNTVELLFLDIQMPGMTGIQWLRGMKEPPMVIMTTAFEQYAVEGFELNVTDYLVKPISFDRFLAAANKALHQFVLHKGADQRSQPEDVCFFVHSAYKEIRITFQDVLFVEGFKDYVRIFTTTQVPPILTRLNLKAIEAKLPADRFCRVHNSFIVALDKIDSFQKTQIFLHKKAIPIGDKYAAAFRAKYKN